MTMRYLNLCFLCLFALLFLRKSQAQESIILSPGQKKIFKVLPKQQIYVKQGGLLRLEDKGNQLHVLALKTGSTLLQIGQRAYTIRIYKDPLHKKILLLKKMIDNFLGLKLSYKNNRPQVTGSLHRTRDWVEISKIFTTCKEQEYLFEAKIDDDLLPEVIELIKKQLKKNILLTAQLKIDKHLKIIAPKGLEEQIGPATCPFGIAVQYNDELTKHLKNIKIKVQFLETQDKNFEKMGIQWQSHVGAQLLPQFINQTDVSSFLISQKNSGTSRSLASPEMVVQEGTVAEFFIGGEFPVSNRTKKTSSVVWKSHGLTLKIRPKLNLAGKINLSVEASLSSLDSPPTPSSPPSLKITKLKNSVVMSNKQILVINKLYKNNYGFSKESLPYMQALPVIGVLFRSQAYLKNQTSLYVLISPEILNAR